MSERFSHTPIVHADLAPTTPVGEEFYKEDMLTVVYNYFEIVPEQAIHKNVLLRRRKNSDLTTITSTAQCSIPLTLLVHI